MSDYWKTNDFGKSKKLNEGNLGRTVLAYFKILIFLCRTNLFLHLRCTSSFLKTAHTEQDEYLINL